MTNRSDARKGFLLDIFTTALEGGIGYWSVCSEYHWQGNDHRDGSSIGEDLDGFYAVIQETEDEDGTTHRIDIETIAKGVNLVVDNPVELSGYDCAGQTVKAIVTACNRVNVAATETPESDIDNGAEYASFDIDADVADIIVQLGLFGEVVYG